MLKRRKEMKKLLKVLLLIPAEISGYGFIPIMIGQYDGGKSILLGVF